jgi:hypothetical protein
MKAKRRIFNLEFRHQHFSIWLVHTLLFLMINVAQTLAQNNISADSAISVTGISDNTLTLFGGTITNSGYGGIVLKFSSINDQFAFMTGGRGAITINNRFTIGGGGYGIANSIDLPGTSQDTNRYFKMGYGGAELGYVFYPGKKVRIGGALLLAAGAAFWQNNPKTEEEILFDDDFNIFPVMEPSLYCEVALNRFMWLHAGISYRYIHHAHLDYMTDQSMRGFSCYIGLLFGN